MDHENIFNENGDVNWDIALEIFKQFKKDTDDECKEIILKCKKCNESFMSKNYLGKYPLCDKHRRKE